MQHLEWQRQSGGFARACNARRNLREPGQIWNAHDHDYYELFWIERGSLSHRWAGESTQLVAGDCICLRPGEEHEAWSDDPVLVINVSFGPGVSRKLASRYRADGLRWPWLEEDPGRRHLVLDERAMRHLAALVDLVDTEKPSGRDLLLLGIVHCLQRSRLADIDRLPPWLRHAVHEALADEDRFSISALARRCRCSREHLSRIGRKATGRPLIDVLTDYRLALAADDLRGGDEPVATVAQRYRFDALAWFYEAFARRYQAPPDAWRRDAQRSV